ncbi:rhodanese-like domain-containing protein [Salimicrobium flavidum]|uniref:Rhodanese-related sulfurtransferase n=1 Tax=Salimicrobium flavidum TaxID=570947 RepID=A0A1N7KBR1_9BACI|nr:rhodanese-like domain-containing protein [Salimicrobium flavidum]SIS59035.1 Rhodanese-related sulfurtransferase [Salimicrobium flavidum]
MAIEISKDAAKQKHNHKNVEVLDVRMKEEVEEGMISGAIHIPLDELGNRINELNGNKEYITVCASGRRSAQAADTLTENGVQAQSLEGGMLGWDGSVTK